MPPIAAVEPEEHSVTYVAAFPPSYRPATATTQKRTVDTDEGATLDRRVVVTYRFATLQPLLANRSCIHALTVSGLRQQEDSLRP